MPTKTTLSLYLTTCITTLFLVACNKPGPAEEAGKKIDQAAEQVHDALQRKESKAEAFIEDSEITARVKTALLRSDALPAMTITVKTQDGTVTLTGSVATPKHRSLAQALTESVDGVRHVNNMLAVVQ